MELYLPSVMIVVLAGLLVFAVLPRLSPLILVVIVSLILAVAGYHHANLFSEEYAISTWQTSVYNTAAPFMIAMVILLCIGFGLNLLRKKVTGQPITLPAVPQMGTNTLRSLIRDPFKTT